MDSPHQHTENSQENAAPEEQTHPLPLAPVAPPPLATASLSLFGAAQPATHSLQQPNISSSLAFAQARFPVQASSVAANLSLSTSTGRIFSKSTVSTKTPTIPLPSRPSRLSTPGPHRPLEPPGNRPLDPPGAAGLLRGTSIVWFRCDLRLHDNECLNAAHNESMSVLPVYCFDPRNYCKSDKSSPYRASYMLESVSDLRRSLRDRGSDLMVRVGSPEEVLPEMARAVGAEAVYAHREVWGDEVKLEERIEAAMKEEGVEVKYFWGSTLFHVDDLPFNVEDMPMDYGRFKERVQGVEVRKTIAALDQLKGSPKRGDVEPGELPSLKDLGLTPSASMAQDGKAPSMGGGETGALQRLKKFAAEYQARPNKGTNNDNVYGGDLPCEIPPSLWLSDGCISPRAIFEELKNAISAASKNDDGGSSNGSNWLMDVLCERDFIRFFVKKHSSPVKQGALAGTNVLV